MPVCISCIAHTVIFQSLLANTVSSTDVTGVFGIEKSIDISGQIFRYTSVNNLVCARLMTADETDERV